jgi:thioredoxin reductase
MAGKSINTQTLIVGASPVGLFAANEWARYNLRCRLIEERFVTIRTLEGAGDFSSNP